MTTRPEPSDSGPAHGVPVAPGVVVSEGQLNWSFSRSSGPGGQNVNKLSTKAELRVAVDELPISGRVRGRLRSIAGGKIIGASTETRVLEDGRTVTREVGGELVLVSQSERSQSANKAECLAKLRELLVHAQHEPKVRRKTRPSRGSVERRLESKKRTSEKKRERGREH